MIETKLYRLIIIKIKNKIKTRHEHLWLEIPIFLKFLKTWGETVVVKVAKKRVPKIQKKEGTCLFVGNADRKDGEYYRMHEPIKTMLI